MSRIIVQAIAQKRVYEHFLAATSDQYAFIGQVSDLKLCGLQSSRQQKRRDNLHGRSQETIRSAMPPLDPPRHLERRKKS